MRTFFRLSLLISLLLVPLLLTYAEGTPATQMPVVVEKYSNSTKDDYLQVLGRVHTYLSIAEQNIATELGLMQYGQGFYHPVTIRFVDGAPAINENPFFYVQPTSDPSAFSQQLFVNVEAFAQHRKDAHWKDQDLRNGFYYAMTQLILNDLAGGDQGKTLPVWVQEGLAVYVSDSGDAIVAEAAGRIRRKQVIDLVGDLNRPYPYLTKVQWARYYLAIKYIYDTGGVNAFQGFVREMLSGQTAADAVLHTLSQEWPVFKKNVEVYTTQAFLPFTLSDDDPRARTDTSPLTQNPPIVNSCYLRS